jgi:hypothetical protein
VSQPIDSLDIVELVMAIEEALPLEPGVSPAQREETIREIAKRIASGEFGGDDDLDADALASLARNLGPRPRGQAGAAVLPPEEPFFE